VVPPLLIRTALAQLRASVWTPDEVLSAAAGLSTGLATAVLVYLVVRRIPWPRPFGLRLAALQLVVAAAAASVWLVSSSAVVALVSGGSLVAQVVDRSSEMLLIGTILFAVVAGLSLAIEASARAARAEALTARTQLAALRAQLHPHFLFNALHTVVQLIPVEPQRAADAAVLVADLLRTTIEEQRDEVSLDDEWRFVSRYLEIERIRFGDRLTVRADMADALLDARVPAFALQTLVENAVQHGAAPRVAPTEIVVTAAGSASELTLSVRNTGDRGTVATTGAATATTAGTGTGLARLRERLAVLYGSAARLVSRPLDGGGYEAVLVVPRQRGSAA
jgi:LytS/YehU family sensor histidine kinase